MFAALDAESKRRLPVLLVRARATASGSGERMAFKQDFQKEKREAIEERRARTEDHGRVPLGEAAKMYFGWKGATNREGTLARERRIFKQVEKFIGASVQLRRIDLELLREYQQERRKQISPTMRKAVSPRSIDYELQLLRGVMQHANCWKGDLAERFKPLKESKSRAGKKASNEQLMKIIETAKRTSIGNWRCTVRP